MSLDKEKEQRHRRKAKLAVIRASEIGAYVYCRRAWWLRRVAGFEPEDSGQRFAAGIAAHVRHGERLRRARWQRKFAFFLLGSGLVLLLLALLIIIR